MKAKLKRGDVVGYVERPKPALPSVPASRRWHLAQVSDSLSESDVDFLKRLDIFFYQPLIRFMKPVPRDRLSHSQRKSPFRPMREKIEPFFPGYAFVDYADAGERWREIFKMKHIRGLCCANNMPVEVPFSMIKEIQAREVDGAVPGATKMLQMPYMLGERVRVANGAFREFSGTVERLPTFNAEQMGNVSLEELDDSVRVHLLVDIFGRSTPVALSIQDIEKI